VLPYNMLLHSPTRESLGINLRNAVVIVDEAHNIVDAVNGMYSVTLTATQVSHWLTAPEHSKLLAACTVFAT
jgi:chromosome transmission fidelity protein 1